VVFKIQEEEEEARDKKRETCITTTLVGDDLAKLPSFLT
jgi:hypothetical protein